MTTESSAGKAGSKLEGFVSAESKKTFTNAAGIIGGACLALQFILPMVLMYTSMPGMFMGNISVPDIDEAVLWKGQLWFTEMNVRTGRHEPTFRLRRMDLHPPPAPQDAEASPPLAESVAEIPNQPSYLLPAGKDLWLFSNYNASSVFRNGELLPLPDLEYPEGASAPFVHEGQPSVVVSTSGGYRLAQLRDSRWVDADRPIYVPRPWMEESCYGLMVVESGGGLVTYYRAEGALFFLPHLPTNARDADAENWRRVGRADGYVIAKGAPQPTVLLEKHQEMQKTFSVSTWDGAEFGITGQLPPMTAFQVTAFGAPAEEGTFLLSQFFPGAFSLRHIKDGEVLSRKSYGKNMFGNLGDLMVLPNLAAIILTLLVIFIYAKLMRTHRTWDYTPESGEDTVEYASLLRRGAAQIVDTLLLGAPFAFVWLEMFEMFSDLETMFSVDGLLHLLAIGAGASIWGFFGLFTLSISEGLWGSTPGKWAAGIRVVGLDLQPCGVGRGIVRNLFKLVDGMFNFMVGLMLVALSPKWQRLGDMVAKTLVIRKKDATTRPIQR